MQILNITAMLQPAHFLTTTLYPINFKELICTQLSLITAVQREVLNQHSLNEKTELSVTMQDAQITREVLYLSTGIEAESTGVSATIQGSQITREVLYLSTGIEAESTGVSVTMQGAQITRVVAYLSSSIKPANTVMGCAITKATVTD